MPKFGRREGRVPKKLIPIDTSTTRNVTKSLEDLKVKSLDLPLEIHFAVSELTEVG